MMFPLAESEPASKSEAYQDLATKLRGLLEGERPSARAVRRPNESLQRRDPRRETFHGRPLQHSARLHCDLFPGGQRAGALAQRREQEQYARLEIRRDQY